MTLTVPAEAQRDDRATTRPRPGTLALAVAPAAVLALVYVIVSPPSPDLAAQLLRARLFAAEGFGLWNNWWYSGHHILGYSVLFPPLAAALTPQIAGGLAAVAAAGIFARLTIGRFGAAALAASLWFSAATATELFSGRLTFALGLAFACACVLALERRRYAAAGLAAVLTALASPVAALPTAVAAGSVALLPGTARRDRIGALVTAALAVTPPILLAVTFPAAGTEPFSFSAFWPIALLCAIAALALPRPFANVRLAAALYGLACLAAFLIPSPVGGNIARPATLVAGPLAALAWLPALARGDRRRRRLAAAVLGATGLLYLQLQAPVRDVSTLAGDPTTHASFYRPLFAFLARQPGPPFRIEIPFTKSHWEAYEVAPRFPLARGWERQLDRGENPLFYGKQLSARQLRNWLHRQAVRFLALPHVPLDTSARREASLARSQPAFLRKVAELPGWTIFAVVAPTPIVDGPARLLRLDADGVLLAARGPGRILLRVRFSPYWRLSRGAGCVAPAGTFTSVRLRHRGVVRMGMAFSLTRIAAESPRCN